MPAVNNHSVASVYMVAGEASGDLLAASFAAALLRKNPLIQLAGVGGGKMAAAGVAIEEDMHALSIVGFTEVIGGAWSIYQLSRRIRLRLLQDRPDVLVLIDAPEFNLRLAHWAVRHGFKVFYLVGPQIWAWRFGRIKNIKRSVHHMAVLLPFESDLYTRYGVPNFFIQHPLYLESILPVNRAVVFQRLNFKNDSPVLVLMPGSRRAELTRHLKLMYDSYLLLKQQKPDLQCVCLRADHLDLAEYEQYLGSDVTIVAKQNHEILSIATAALVVSGTATLEVALHRVPMVVIYKASRLTYTLATWLVRIPYFALCNWILGEKVVPELIQHEVRPQLMANILMNLLTDSTDRKLMCKKLAGVCDIYARSGSMDDLSRKLLDLKEKV